MKRGQSSEAGRHSRDNRTFLPGGHSSAQKTSSSSKKKRRLFANEAGRGKRKTCLGERRTLKYDVGRGVVWPGPSSLLGVRACGPPGMGKGTSYGHFCSKTSCLVSVSIYTYESEIACALTREIVSDGFGGRGLALLSKRNSMEILGRNNFAGRSLNTSEWRVVGVRWAVRIFFCSKLRTVEVLNTRSF